MKRFYNHVKKSLKVTKERGKKMNEQTNEKYAIYNAIVGWACIIWAVASIGLMMYFTGLNQVTFAIMTVGQLFVIIGIILLNRKKISGAVAILAGLSCVIIPAVNEWGGIFFSNVHGSKIFPSLLSSAIGIIGLAMMIVPGILEDIAKTKCKKVVTGECVDFDQNQQQDGTVVYAPIYQYEYKGNLYTKCTGKYKKVGLPDIGHKIELKINEFNPQEVYIEATSASKMIIYILGASLFIMGLGMVLTIFGI